MLGDGKGFPLAGTSQDRGDSGAGVGPGAFPQGNIERASDQFKGRNRPALPRFGDHDDHERRCGRIGCSAAGAAPILETMELRGASALVTGAGRGIGRAIALALGKAEVRVTALSRTRDELESLVREIESADGRAVAYVGDIQDRSACDGAVARAVEAHGGLQILVNNAAVAGMAPFAEMTDEQWDAVWGTNLTAVFRLTRAALPHLARKGGHVFMISSLAGKNPVAGLSAYCASKAALDHLAACLMLEVRQKGVKVTTIAPGSVDTSFGGPHSGEGSWKLTSEDVAGAVLDLLRTRDDAHLSRVEMRPLRPPKA
jgi:3-oxoacyl-[acyl-carrier protein] reductase